jgi:uncharacterized FlaG/YvyC family protein
MRIDGLGPIPSAVSEPAAHATKARSVPASPAVKDRVETQHPSEPSSTNVVVEMQPGNIVVYKFIDHASGRLIQQIPSEQMLNLSELVEVPKGRQKS